MVDWNRIVKNTGTIEEIAEQLNALSHRERVAAVRTMGGPTQALLWEMAEGRSVAAEDMVPADVPPLKPIIHYGKNSLPLLTNFEKRFCRPTNGGNGGVLLGYNEGVTRPFVGPGYFVVRDTPASTKGSLVIDYYRTPSEKPPEWPKIANKDHGIPALVYGFMHDYLRKVSDHVTVGRAYKHHKITNNYFLLCRQA
jgi:hypothetical protein